MIPSVAHPYILAVLTVFAGLVAYLWKRGEAADQAERTAMRSDHSQLRADHDASEGEILAELGRMRDRMADHDTRLPDRFVTRVEFTLLKERLDQMQAGQDQSSRKLDRILERLPSHHA